MRDDNGEEVEFSDIAKAYESEDGEMVILTKEDLASLPVEQSHEIEVTEFVPACLLYTSPSPRDKRQSRMPSSA